MKRENAEKKERKKERKIKTREIILHKTSN